MNKCDALSNEAVLGRGELDGLAVSVVGTHVVGVVHIFIVDALHLPRHLKHGHTKIEKWKRERDLNSVGGDEQGVVLLWRHHIVRYIPHTHVRVVACTQCHTRHPARGADAFHLHCVISGGV